MIGEHMEHMVIAVVFAAFVASMVLEARLDIWH
jgi:hypothetical protein